MLVCLTGSDWSAPVDALLSVAPRLAVGTDLVWVDARGLDAVQLAHRLLEQCPARVRAGVARAPSTAQVAAHLGREAHRVVVADANERAWLSDRPLSVLPIEEKLLVLLQGVGVETCGALAALEREAVEVRFGPELIEFWQYARAEDRRQLFQPIPPEAPHASLDFVDYVISDPERLIFSVNALFGTVCAALHARAQHARRVRVTLSLANGESWQRVLRPARPTASRTAWLRLARAVLERITVSDAVTGIALVVDGMEAAAAVQGDLFDVGFATSSAVDAALGRLIEAQGDVVVEPEVTEHPLPEARTSFVAERPAEWVTARKPEAGQANERADRQNGALTLQLLPTPREVLVETVRRRDHILPIRYRDEQWKQLVTAAGPDRISGGRWEESYAREYFRAVTVDGLLVWLYRDARTDRWYLHGWWD
jgi:protein ImuB